MDYSSCVRQRRAAAAPTEPCGRLPGALCGCGPKRIRGMRVGDEFVDSGPFCEMQRARSAGWASTGELATRPRDSTLLNRCFGTGFVLLLGVAQVLPESLQYLPALFEDSLGNA